MKNIWKTIDNFHFKEMSSCTNYLIQKNYEVSLWIQDISNRDKSTFLFNRKINLARVSLNQLGFNSATKLKDVYQAYEKFGFKTVDPIIAIYTRLIYDEQPTGEWLRISVPLDSMVDSDGVPHLPKLGKGLGKLFIETYWSYPDAIFHPHNEFVVEIL